MLTKKALDRICSCRVCSRSFSVTAEDQVFYEKLGVPIPACCPCCRLQRRLAWRNERTLYRRRCDASGRDILSVFDDNVPFPVYSPECWYGDSWSPLVYGRDFDFSKSFFEQFAALLAEVPQLALSSAQTKTVTMRINVAGQRIVI